VDPDEALDVVIARYHPHSLGAPAAIARIEARREAAQVARSPEEEAAEQAHRELMARYHPHAVR
jgi:hypothetical protein